VCISNVQVKMVRIQWADRQNLINHSNNVTVGMPEDSETKHVYLRIAVDQKVYLVHRKYGSTR
jgi:hypothetical protein